MACFVPLCDRHPANCKIDIAKLKNLNNYLNKICICQKKAVPLHQI